MSEASTELPDVNVLVALTNQSHVFHVEAHRWLATVETFATTPVTEAGLLRLLLNPLVTGRELSVAAAMAVLVGVRADPRAVFLVDDFSLADTLTDLAGLTGHRQVTDWHLLGLVARHGARLVTFDRKLARAVGAPGAARITTLGG